MHLTGYFITGTDTGCGKTEISAGLMQLLRRRGESVLGMKPVASGAEPTPAGLRNEDALRLQAEGGRQISYDLVNPFVFEPPIAPHLAARQAGARVDLDLILAQCHRLAADADSLVVEGVGGWRVPLNDHQSVSDLALLLGLPVVLVVGMKLGCINHALLSVESIRADGLDLAGWVANRVEPEMLAAEENIETLKALIPEPCLGVVPYLESPSAERVASCLRLP